MSGRTNIIEASGMTDLFGRFKCSDREPKDPGAYSEN